MRNLSREQI